MENGGGSVSSGMSSTPEGAGITIFFYFAVTQA